MFLSSSVLGLSAAGVESLSAVHLLGALGLILALLIAELSWPEEPRGRWAAASTQAPPPEKRAGVIRRIVCDRHALAGVHH